jgi:uncharacterized coiled-coil protein SlyX
MLIKGGNVAMTNPAAEAAKGLSGVAGESAEQNFLERLLENLRSASDAQRDSVRRLLFPAYADGTEGDRQVPEVADSREAKVRPVTKDRNPVGIVITAAVAIFAASFGFALYSLDNRINLLTSSMETRLSTLETKLTSMETRLSTAETKIGSMETKLGFIETRLGAVETRLTSVETRLTSEETSISELSKDVTGLKSSIDRLLQGLDARPASDASR